MSKDRIKDLIEGLFRLNQRITEDAEDTVQNWIDDNQVTRADAEQIADSDGNFLEERLAIMLDRDIEDGAIFFDEKEKEDEE